MIASPTPPSDTSHPLHLGGVLARGYVDDACGTVDGCTPAHRPMARGRLHTRPLRPHTHPPNNTAIFGFLKKGGEGNPPLSKPFSRARA